MSLCHRLRGALFSQILGVGEMGAFNNVLTNSANDDAAVIAGTAYLRQVSPFYGFFGLSLALFFASQGAARMALPTVAALFRLIVIVAGGIIASTAGGGYAALLVVIVLGHVPPPRPEQTA